MQLRLTIPQSTTFKSAMQQQHDPASIPLDDLRLVHDRRADQTRLVNHTTEQDGSVDFDKIDVHSFTGLTTILAVNIQQLVMLIQVGPDLGAMFYVLISITSISAILVVLLLPIRYVLEACKKMQIDRRIKTALYYTSLVLNVIIMVLNLVLQFFDQTEEKCHVLLSQPLPEARTDPK